MNKISAIIVLLIVLGCKSDSKNTSQTFTQLTRFVDQYSENIVEQGNVNTMSVAIYKNGELYHNYYGKTDSIVNTVPDDSTLFEIASITKVFTGALMAKAVVDNKTTLDTDIRTFLPNAYPNLAYNGFPVTIKNLVTHTLGFETPKKLESVYQKIFSGKYQSNPIDYDINTLFEELKTVKVKYKPGTVYDYNNVGPDLTAYILEKIYHKSYPDILQEFLNEVGMQDTYLQEYDRFKDRLITGYTETGKVATVDENPLLGGASGIITSLPDLAKFMKYLLESNTPLIKEATRSLFKNNDENVGYFWDLGYADVEGFYYLKTGTSNGVQSIILICPDSDYGQILLMNNTSEKATRDWLSLYNRIEHDLIQYPKINLWSKLEPTFHQNPKEATKQYLELKKDTSRYFSSSDYLNRVGYDFLYRNEIKTAIKVFKLAIAADPRNPNLYDSLGEAFFKVADYEKSKENYETSLKLDPNNSNAEKFIKEIALLLAKKS